MRTETTVRKLYQYDELTGDAKETARDWYVQGAYDYDWWESTYEDAKNIGLKIRGFDIDRGSCCEAEFMASAEETAHKIEKEHGESCETRKDAENYLKERDSLIESSPRDENGEFSDEYELDASLDELDKEFLKTLQEDYLSILKSVAEDMVSREVVEENIIANEYEFLENGKRA